MPDTFVVGRKDLGPLPDGTPQAYFASLRDAEDYLDQLEQLDIQGVRNGLYYVDIFSKGKELAVEPEPDDIIYEDEDYGPYSNQSEWDDDEEDSCLDDDDGIWEPEGVDTTLYEPHVIQEAYQEAADDATLFQDPTLSEKEKGEIPW